VGFLGLIDYAWTVSLQKDDTKVKIIEDPNIDQPVLKADNLGFTITMPTPKFVENGSVNFLGYNFENNADGKIRIGRLFRAAIFHLSTHTILPLPNGKVSDSKVEVFVKSLIADMYVNAYLEVKCPSTLIDTAYANALAFQKIKSQSRIYTVSTRVMASLLRRLWINYPKTNPTSEEDLLVDQIAKELTQTKRVYLEEFDNNRVALISEKVYKDNCNRIIELLDPLGPFLESPSLRHTESLGPCSIYTDFGQNALPFQEIFFSSLYMLGSSLITIDNIDQLWKPEQDYEALQAFNSDQYQKQREEKILSKIQQYIAVTNFKSVSFPEEDYTQYLRARSLVQGASRRLLDILRSSFNYLDEDPRQEMGQLDLAAVIQSLASNKPATDVFVLDEYLKPSFAWSILFDVSNSMQVKGEYGRALAIAVAEAAKELMLDATSWTFFAFSDKLYVLKDSSESYSKRVRARIGGLKFEGLTYIPDAIQVAGKMLAKRFEEQRCLIVISDGWPYGYDEMPLVLKKSVENLLNKGVIVIGIGVETDQMGKYFKLHSSVYTQKDLINKFGSLYANASEKALET
jgi:hypothetical protein